MPSEPQGHQTCNDFVYPAGRFDVWFCDNCDYNIALHKQTNWLDYTTIHIGPLRARGAKELKKGEGGIRRVFDAQLPKTFEKRRGDTKCRNCGKEQGLHYNQNRELIPCP